MFMRLIHYDETELKLKMGNTLEDVILPPSQVILIN